MEIGGLATWTLLVGEDWCLTVDEGVVAVTPFFNGISVTAEGALLLT